MLVGQDRGRPFLVRVGEGLLGEISAIVGKMAETFRGSLEYRPGGSAVFRSECHFHAAPGRAECVPADPV
jgi:hypothetical protein